MSRFSDYVTSVSFHLSLSREQCSMLHWIVTLDGKSVTDYRRFCPALKALHAKGLISQIEGKEREKIINKRRAIYEQHPPVWKPTEEGKLVHKLLIKANIVPWVNQNIRAALSSEGK